MHRALCKRWSSSKHCHAPSLANVDSARAAVSLSSGALSIVRSDAYVNGTTSFVNNDASFGGEDDAYLILVQV